MRTYPIRVSKIFHQIMPKARFNLDHGNDDRFSLSFDDGPDPGSTPLLLNLLYKLNIKATFFLLGARANMYPTLVDDIKSAGHTIGSHGYAHLNGWQTEDQAYIDDASRARDILETNVFRPPYGKISRRQYQKLESQYEIILWSLMPGDFDQHVDAPILLSRMRKKIRDRDIVVLHDTPYAITKLQEVLPPLIEELSTKQLYHTSL